MKKVISIALALMMVLSLAACGGSGDDSDGSAVSTLTDDELVDKLSAIVEGKTGEMPVETTSFKRLSDAGFETAGLFSNWFNGMEVPEGALIAVNQPLMGQAHVVLLIQPAEGTDIETLKSDLDANANPAWNICMVADSVSSCASNGLILFVMTSKSELGLDAESFTQSFIDSFAD